MKVSILIPLYNSEKYIDETLNSALNQTWENIEIIVVDDGSSDSSLEIAKKYESDVVKVYSQNNKGAPSARNLAIEKSKGIYIQFLDSDDLLAPNKIETQIKELAKYDFCEDIIASCGWIEFQDGANIKKLTKRETSVCKDYEPAYLALIDYWELSFPSIPYHNYLTHRKKIECVGKWNELLVKNQDSEYFARILSNCKKMLYIDNTIVFYRDAHNSIKNANSETKVYSELISNKIITQIILSKISSSDAIYACSLRYTEFIESRYPLNRKYLKETYNDMKEYGLSFVISNRGVTYRILYALFGWKISMNILKIYHLLKKSICIIIITFNILTSSLNLNL